MSSTDNSAVEGGMPSSGGQGTGGAGGQSSYEKMGDTARQGMGEIKDKAERTTEKYTERAADQLRVLSEGIRSGAERIESEQSWAGRPLYAAADRLSTFSDSLRSKSGGALMRDVTDLARSNPGLFYAACAVAGFAAARLLTAPANGAANGRYSDADDSYLRTSGDGSSGGYASGSSYGSSEFGSAGGSSYDRTGGDNV